MEPSQFISFAFGYREKNNSKIKKKQGKISSNNDELDEPFEKKIDRLGALFCKLYALWLLIFTTLLWQVIGQSSLVEA